MGLQVNKHLIHRDKIVPALVWLRSILRLLMYLAIAFIVLDESVLQARRVGALHLSQVKLGHLLLEHAVLLLAIFYLIVYVAAVTEVGFLKCFGGLVWLTPSG